MYKNTKAVLIGMCMFLLVGCGQKDSKWEQVTPTPTTAVSSENVQTTITAVVTDVPTMTPELTLTITPEPTVTSTEEAPTITPVVTEAPSDDILEVSRTMYAVTRLYIREKDTSSSQALGILEINVPVKVTGITNGGWARIEYEDGEAYVFYEYLTDTPTIDNTPTPTSTATPTPKPVVTKVPEPENTPLPSITMGTGFTPVNNFHGIHGFSNNLHASGQQMLAANSDVVSAHLACVNELRASVGLPALVLDDTASNIAAYRTAEMIFLDYFDHYHPTYPKEIDYACAFDVVYFYQDGYTRLAENIAEIGGKWGYFYDNDKAKLGEALYEQFAGSQGHYENMVNPNFTKIGICAYVSDDYVLITQIFE
ncbi:MAG: CAP domain-containing protein [Lachnospiraceae bacterium]